MKRLAWNVGGVVGVALALGACGSDSAGDTLAEPGTAPTGSRGVTMGGAQDIALFRTIVAGGGVPTSDTLDPVGFFAEHALDLPASDCGEAVCLHPTLAVAPRFDGSNWTMAYVALGSSLDPATLPRPPVHVALALERTTGTITQWGAVETGVRALVTGLRDEDRVSLVVFGTRARVLVRETSPRGMEIADALAALAAEPRDTSFAPNVSLYDGLAASADLVDGFAGAKRVLLLTTGHATAGVTDREQILALGEGHARLGTSISVIGAGAAAGVFDPTVPAELGSIGAGRYSVAESVEDLAQIFRDEGETTMVPLALDFALRVEPSPGYRVGRIYGARRAKIDGGAVVLTSPALFLGLREGAADVGGGRRGGGSGLFVELIADPDSGLGGGAPAFAASATWTRPEGGSATVTETIRNDLAPGQNPEGMWATLSGGVDMKPFMMLNMYLSLRAMTVLHESGDCTRARGVWDMMGASISLYQTEFDDPDIDADSGLLRMLRMNLDGQCTPIPPVEPITFEGGCMVS